MGKVTAEQLAQEGHIVYGAARRVDQMAELETLGGYALEVDVTNDESMVTAVNQIIQEQGKIDVLINNAGFGMYGSVEDTSMEDARSQNGYLATHQACLFLPNFQQIATANRITRHFPYIFLTRNVPLCTLERTFVSDSSYVRYHDRNRKYNRSP